MVRAAAADGEMLWVAVYRLDRDVKHIEQVQRASRETQDYGFPTEPALFGSTAWWSLIDRGALPARWVEGRISAVYWGSMGDWPEFKLRLDDGSERSFTRQGDVRRYAVGLGARVRVVELHRKPTSSPTRTTNRSASERSRKAK